MMTRNPIHAESTERSTYATEVVFIYVRLGAEFINRREIIAHTLTSVVTADLFVPFLTEAR